MNQLECMSCGATYDPQEEILLCKRCESPLDVKFDLDKIRERLDRDDLGSRPTNVWRYREFLPITDERNIVSLGEGWTPIQRADNYGKAIGLRNLHLKLEYLNPTGSFKDRGSTVLISKVKELGFSSVADDSSGNAGASISAYCAKARIKCTIYVPASAPAGKLVQASIYGANLVKVPGSRSDVSRAIDELWRQRRIHYASHNLSPFFLEGMKTFGYEVAEQMKWQPQSHIVFPVGGGTLMIGAWKAFEEMRTLDWIRGAPAMHCVQSDACMPIVIAYRRKLANVEPVEEGETIAGGIRIANPARGRKVLEILGSTRGSAVSVSDTEILQHQRLIAQEEGVFAEPTSCAVLAGLAKLCEIGTIHADESVLVSITGFGLKDVKSAAKNIGIEA